jgi:hypothetical protein
MSLVCSLSYHWHTRQSAVPCGCCCVVIPGKDKASRSTAAFAESSDRCLGAGAHYTCGHVRMGDRQEWSVSDTWKQVVIVIYSIQRRITNWLANLIIRELIEDWRSRNSLLGIATGYGLDDRGVGVRVPAGSRIYLLYVVQTGCGVHPTSYRMCTRGIFPFFLSHSPPPSD